MYFLHYFQLSGCLAVVVGRSAIVGSPMAELLKLSNCTVTVCHSRTRDLAAAVGSADVVVVAARKAGLVRGEWIKEGAVVVDCGINQVEDKTKKSGERTVEIQYKKENC